ncbi:hypothetical protein BCR42DRAFT_407928 [Absidia repens]|uniref:Homeobox domain-containing protein n=1 Tax=Absidia repens TaxID=90262 RepID=A0A1X2ISW9_9FUNG|nr:hypothetical protein BCR42DRAFT_407928 [Absidia repens]
MHSSSNCSLPPISDLFALPRRDSNCSLPGMNYQQNHTMVNANYNHTNNNAMSYQYREKSTFSSKVSSSYPPLKAKRKRASPSQLSVLNRVFAQTYFPSTELRIELGKHLGMSPRTVQIWFQNKRQSLRSRTRRSSFSSMEGDEAEEEEEESASFYYSQQQRYQYEVGGCPSSPPWTPTSGSIPAGNNFEYPFVLPPPSSSGSSSSPRPSSSSSFSSSSSSSSSPVMPSHDHHHNRRSKINLPPLRLNYGSHYPPSPPSSTYPSPISIDSILQ